MLAAVTKPTFVEGDDPKSSINSLRKRLKDCYAEIRGIQQEGAQERLQEAARLGHESSFARPGMDLPQEVDGIPSRAHSRASGPAGIVKDNPEHLKILEAWMKFTRPRLFDETASS